MTSTIKPRNLVCVDDGTKVYVVQAVSRAGQDVYLTEGVDTSIGTWVSIQSVTLVRETP